MGGVGKFFKPLAGIGFTAAVAGVSGGFGAAGIFAVKKALFAGGVATAGEVLSAATKPKLPKHSNFRKYPSAMTVADPNAPLPMIFGTYRIGANVVRYPTPTGSTCNIIAIFCEGEIDSFASAGAQPKVYINDVVYASLKTGTDITRTISSYTGTNSQSIDSRFQAGSDGTKFVNCAYVAMTLTQSVHLSGYALPTISAEINGKKFTPIDEGTAAFTHNPAAALYGVMRDLEGISAGQMDNTNSWTAGETYLASIRTFDYAFTEPVTINDMKKLIMEAGLMKVVRSEGKYKLVWEGTKNYTPSGAGTVTAQGTDTDLQFVDDNLTSDTVPRAEDDFYNYMVIKFTGGTAANIGQVRIITDYDQSSSQVTLDEYLPAAIAVDDTYQIIGAFGFTMDTIVRGTLNPAERDTPNIARIHWIDVQNGWKREVTERIAEKDVETYGERPYNEECWYIISNTIAQRRCNLRYKQSLYMKQYVTLTGLPQAARCEVFDIITITEASYGWTRKQFQIIELERDMFGRPTIIAREFYQEIYDDSTAPSEAGDQNILTAHGEVNPVTGIGIANTTPVVNQDGTVVPCLEVTFTRPADHTFWSHVEIWLSTNDSDYYLVGGPTASPFEVSATSGRFKVDDTVSLRTVAVNVGGFKEDFPGSADDYVVVTGDVTAPSAPTGLSATDNKLNKVRLEWTNPSDRDLAFIEVWRSTTNDSGTASLLDRISAAEPGDTQIWYSGQPTMGTTHYYWLKAVDSHGNTSGFSSGTSAATTPPTTTYPKVLSGLAFSWNGGAARCDWTAGAVALNGTYTSIASGNTTNKYVYWDGSSGTLGETDTKGTALASGNWIMCIVDTSAGAVYPAEGIPVIHAAVLQADSITASEIAASTITATELNVSQLSAITANLGTCTAGALYSGTISSAASGSTGQRVVIANASNDINVYDSSNNLRVDVGDVTGTYRQPFGVTVNSGSIVSYFKHDGPSLSAVNSALMGCYATGAIAKSDGDIYLLSLGAGLDETPSDFAQLTNGKNFRGVSLEIKNSDTSSTTSTQGIYAVIRGYNQSNDAFGVPRVYGAWFEAFCRNTTYSDACGIYVAASANSSTAGGSDAGDGDAIAIWIRGATSYTGNAYGLYIHDGITADNGGTGYAIYSAATELSYFAGSIHAATLGVGAANSGTYALEVTGDVASTAALRATTLLYCTNAEVGADSNGLFVGSSTYAGAEFKVNKSGGAITKTMTFTPQSANPSSTEGIVFCDSDDHKLKFYNGTAWYTLDMTAV